MQYRVLTWIVAMLLASTASLQTVHAQAVTSLDSDLFAPGTDVSNAFAGVTLQAMTLQDSGLPMDGPFTTWIPSYSAVYASAGNFLSASPTENTGWGYFFGPLDSNGVGDCFQQCTGMAGNNFLSNLLVSFDTPVSQISISQIGNPFNDAAVEAFNSADQEVGYCVANGPLPVGTYDCGSGSFTIIVGSDNSPAWQISTTISAPDISKVLIGAYNNSGDEVNTIRYMAAPEIDPNSVASGLTLLLGGLAVLLGARRRFDV